MSGRILIVDDASARRVLLRASLHAAHFGTTAASDPHAAAEVAAAHPPDVILADLRDAGGMGALRALRARLGPLARLVALTPPDRPELRLVALKGGADDALDHGTAPALLQARIRSLLRARDEAAEMGLREEAPGGLAEAAAAFAPAPLAAPRAQVAVAGVRAVPPDLAALPGCELSVLPVRPAEGWQRPDLVAVDGTGARGAGSGDGPAEALRLLADLRSRAATRHAALLVLLPAGATDAAAMALDLGAGDVVTGEVPADELAARVHALLRRKAQADRRRDRIRSGLQAADRDPLTGLHNRRFAEPALERLAARARDAGRDFAVMILDIDHFKAINDTWGHAVGDRVLAGVARRVRDAVRPQDLVARIGGEEFMVAMPDTGPEAARAAAERLRRAVAARPFAVRAPEERRALQGTPWVHGGATTLASDEVLVTVSVGVAVCAAGLPDPSPCPALYERADGALYAAKTAGRNMVAMALSGT